MTGNPDFTVGVYGALGGAAATLVIDAAEPPVSARHPRGGLARASPPRSQGSGAAAASAQ